MRTLIVILNFLSIAICAIAESGYKSEKDLIFSEAQFPGGYEALCDWITDNANYPSNALPYGISTFVTTSFDISEDGSVENIWLDVEGYKEFDFEAYRLISSLPKWLPAKQNGKAVKDHQVLGFMFTPGEDNHENTGIIQSFIPVMSEEYSLLEYLTLVSEKLKKDHIPYPGENAKDTSQINYRLKDASFEGGLPALYNWLGNNIKYPTDAPKYRIEDTVRVKFKINKDGTIGEAQAINLTDPALEAEALKVVHAMPRWQPARLMGKPITSYYILPIRFTKPQ